MGAVSNKAGQWQRALRYVTTQHRPASCGSRREIATGRPRSSCGKRDCPDGMWALAQAERPAYRRGSGRDVAQPGSASHWGCGGRRFESSRPDQWFPWKTKKLSSATPPAFACTISHHARQASRTVAGHRLMALQVAVVLLAEGASTRFGPQDKLSQPMNGFHMARTLGVCLGPQRSPWWPSKNPVRPRLRRRCSASGDWPCRGRRCPVRAAAAAARWW